MRWIRQRINNIKLQNKLASIYIVTGLIPLFVLFAFAFGQMRSILMDRDLKSMQGSLEQSVATVDGQIEVYNNLSNYITFMKRFQVCLPMITAAHMKCTARLLQPLTLCCLH